MTRTLERSAVENALFDAELDEDALYEDYSGRAMYGDKCLGIVYKDNGAVARFYLALSRELDDDGETAEEMTRAERGDSMGLSAIAYWPGWTLEEK